MDSHEGRGVGGDFEDSKFDADSGFETYHGPAKEIYFERCGDPDPSGYPDREIGGLRTPILCVKFVYVKNGRKKRTRRAKSGKNLFFLVDSGARK